jgi:hypothetical protein
MLSIATYAYLNPLGNRQCVHEYDHPSCSDNDPFNGYWWNGGWVPFYPSIEAWFTPAPVWSEGNAVFYDLGPMAATAALRGFDLSAYQGGVALMSPADIGQRVWLKPPGKSWEGPYLVVDSAARGDIFPVILYRQEVVEVDWPTAQRWGMVSARGQVLHWRLENVQVSKLPPEELLHGCPLNYPSWWLDQVTSSRENYLIKTPVYEFPSTWKIYDQWVTFQPPSALDAWREQSLYRDFQSCQLALKNPVNP